MLRLRDGIVELYKKVATSIPKDVEDALKDAHARETDPHFRDSLGEILQRIVHSRVASRPVCDDTGFPVFFVKVPRGLSQQHIREVIMDATRVATRKVPLSPNAVDVVTGENTGDNVGERFPLVYIEETEQQSLVVDLMLGGGDCENLGQTYTLPTLLDGGRAEMPESEQSFADRDFAGVGKCVVDAVIRAQGRACPPFCLGVAVGGARDQVTSLSKQQLLRRLNSPHPNETLASLEMIILKEINELGLRKTGTGARTTALGVKVSVAHRQPASYFVDVSFSCWAHRRGRLIW